MDSCKKCGSHTMFLRRVAALEVTLPRPAYLYETYCPICAWCGGAIQALHPETSHVRRRGQELASM
jgi:hypothetical protein